jgi:multidrug efflux pump subunit AcrB
MNMNEGLSGNIAKMFINSKLTILLMIAFLLIGGYSTYLMPREEEPQIKVPMADIFFSYPGASPQEVETKVAMPIEKMISNIKGVEYVYSTSMQGQAMVIVQFYVGEDIERSIVKLYNEVQKNMDKMPQGVSMPLIKTRAIEDVPVLGLTVWSEQYDDIQLKSIGEVLVNEIEKVPNVTEVKLIGGRRSEIKVVLNNAKISQKHIDFNSISNYLRGNNNQSSVGVFYNNDTAFTVQTNAYFTSIADLSEAVVGVYQNAPVYLKDVATLTDGGAQASQYVFYGSGIASTDSIKTRSAQAVTISISKKNGADAMNLAEAVLAKVNHTKGTLIPNEVHISTTRNYGETASHKVSELLLHLVVAVVVVTLFVMLAMGWRGGLVVFLSVPVTFALTLFSYYMMDYTLNRITLFALVFITGIVVDDSIIIAENMHRHFKMKKMSFMDAAIFSINEVGNPTILATFTVIAAVLPMAFVSGLMGPYMSPMPIGASIAMILSLIVALTLTPYLGFMFLREKEKAGDDSHSHEVEDSKIYKIYKGIIDPLLENRTKRYVFIFGTLIILLGSLVLFYTKTVAVKMLPFDNKNEFQVVIDMPEGTSLETTHALTQEVANYISSNPLVKDYQGYVGTSAPISFNGLVRHYDLRGGENVADIQVNLIDKGKRKEQSHDIAKSMRTDIQKIGKKFNANIKVVEVPPGPPVLSTIVAEIYGPDYDEQIKVASQVENLLRIEKDVVDVDWFVESKQPEYVFEIDHKKSMEYGVMPVQINSILATALSNSNVGVMHDGHSFNQKNIVLQLDDKSKTSISEIENIPITNQRGEVFTLGTFVNVKKGTTVPNIYRKNQKRVVYVTADMAGELESPFYAISSVSERLNTIKLPKGYTLQEEYTHQPINEDTYSIKWDGEWQITFEVFRDLGIAFGVVLIVIYLLIVGWFQNFTVPLIMLAAIPLSLIGIVIGHWMLDAYFTATSMIGFIALAGVMVRNSVLLIDFIDIRLKEGAPLKQAIIEAGAVRTTPILLTAGAVVLGAVIILFDPIFQGLAISLMGGTITSTFLTLLVVPLLYYKMLKKEKV